MQLSPRLQAIYDMVPPALVVADIGTDHGTLLASLVTSGRVERAIGTDIRPGPLAQARENLRQWGVHQQVDLRQGDGLKVLSPGEVDVVVMAGIGEVKMAQMVIEGLHHLSGEETLLLQPMGRGERIRQVLYESELPLVDEKALWESGHYYQFLVIKPRPRPGCWEQFHQFPDGISWALRYGPILLAQRSPELLTQLHKEEERLSHLLEGIQEQCGEEHEALSRLRDEKRRVIKWFGSKMS